MTPCPVCGRQALQGPFCPYLGDPWFPFRGFSILGNLIWKACCLNRNHRLSWDFEADFVLVSVWFLEASIACKDLVCS